MRKFNKRSLNEGKGIITAQETAEAMWRPLDTLKKIMRQSPNREMDPEAFKICTDISKYLEELEYLWNDLADHAANQHDQIVRGNK